MEISLVCQILKSSQETLHMYFQGTSPNYLLVACLFRHASLLSNTSTGVNSNTFRVSENVKEGSTQATAYVARLLAVPLWIVERPSKYVIIGDPPSAERKLGESSGRANTQSSAIHRASERK